MGFLKKRKFKSKGAVKSDLRSLRKHCRGQPKCNIGYLIKEWFQENRSYERSDHIFIRKL